MDKRLAVLLVVVLALGCGESCSHLRRPCRSGKCCLLLYNFMSLFYFSLCVPGSTATPQCATDSLYCARDRDCAEGTVCIGEGTNIWGTCFSLVDAESLSNGTLQTVDETETGEITQESNST